MPGNRLPVVAGWVALVLCPMVGRVFRLQLPHVFVPVGLGEDGRRRDGHVFSVPFHDAGVGSLPVWAEAVAVHDDIFRAHF